MKYGKTFLLLAALTALFGAAGFMLGGEVGMLIALGFAAVSNAVSLYLSHTIILKAYRAQPADPVRDADYIAIVERLAARAELPLPKIYVLPGSQPNAFATGRNPDNSAVAATEGLLQIMSNEELAGVMAHELAHIKNRDTLISTVSATLAGALTAIAYWGMLFSPARNHSRDGGNFILMLLVSILAPIAAALIQMAISRAREFGADRLGGEICGNPLWLASALKSLARGTRDHPFPKAESHPATAQMFIINPLAGTRVDRLFSTHPDTESRIAKLREQAAEHRSLVPVSLPGSQRRTRNLQGGSSPSPRTGYGGPWG